MNFIGTWMGVPICDEMSKEELLEIIAFLSKDLAYWHKKAMLAFDRLSVEDKLAVSILSRDENNSTKEE